MEQYPCKQILFALCAYMGQFMVGYSMGWSAPIIPKMLDPDQTPLPAVITQQEASWIASVKFVGAIIGPYVSGFLSNVIGRKPCLYLGAVVTLFSFVMLALARNLAMIYAARIFVGLGTGIVFVVNLVYIGEIASTHIRGVLLTATGFFGTLGTVTAYSVIPFVNYSSSGYIGVAITLVYIISLFFIPETPLFLTLTGQEEKAKETLKTLRREGDFDNVISSKEELANKKSILDQWIEIITVKNNRKALFITLSLNILQQMSGVMSVIFFATLIFELADSVVEPHIATIIIGLTQLSASVFSPFFVERSGRRILLLISTAGCSISLGVLGTYFVLYGIDSPISASLSWLPLVTLIAFFLAYDLAFGIIPRTIIGEIFTSNARSTGATISITLGWLVGFGVSSAFGYMLLFGPHVVFFTYAGACAVAFIFTAIFVPETKGKSLTEIQEMLNR